MRLLLIKTGLISTFFLLSGTTAAVEADNVVNSEFQTDFYACMWFPSCGDPESYSPPEQPEDDKDSSKDDRLA